MSKQNLKKIMKFVMVVVLTCFFCVIASKHIGNNFTKYEYVAVVAIVVSVIFKLIIPIIKENVSIYDVYNVVLYITIVVIAYSIMTYGQIVIDSDVATASLLAKSQIKNRAIFPSSWNYANGDIWAFAINIFMLPFVMMENQIAARMLGSLLFVLFTMAVLCFVSKIYEDKYYLIAIPLVFLCLRGTHSMILYQAAYTGTLLWIILCPCLFYVTIQRTGIKYLILNSAVLFILCMTGNRYIAEIVLPLWLAYIIYSLVEMRKKQPNWEREILKQLKSTGILWIPTIAGLFFYKWLTTWHNMNNTQFNKTLFVPSLEDCTHNISILFQNIFSSFGYSGEVELFSLRGIGNMISIALCILIMFLVPILQMKKIEMETEFVKLFLYFTFVHNWIMITLAIFFAKTVDRYIFSSVFCVVILSARYIMKYWINSPNIFQYLIISAFIVIVAINSILVIDNSRDWRQKLESKKQINVEMQQRGIKKGYATYWNAYNNQIYSNDMIQYGAVMMTENAVEPFRWLVDNEAYRETQGKSFLLLNQDEKQQAKESSLLLEKLSKATEVMECGDYVIYIYDYDLAREFTR